MSSSDRQNRKSWSFIYDSEYKGTFTQVNELRKMQNYFYIRQIARNNLNKFSNADYAKRAQSVFANLNI